jgi:hypothetical protein
MRGRFPYGDHDDLVGLYDTSDLCDLDRGGLIDHPEDYVDEKGRENPRRVYY